MLFFRSEERLHEWCTERRAPRGPTATIEQLWGLATAWYASRLSEDARRPQPEEIRGILAGLGLGGAVWDPSSDQFG